MEQTLCLFLLGLNSRQEQAKSKIFWRFTKLRLTKVKIEKEGGIYGNIFKNPIKEVFDA
jgi:hypothetical protein